MNKQLIFKKRPIGFPDEQTWELETNDIPMLKEGEVLIQHHYISLDPAMRGWMNDNKSYIPPVGIGEVMRAGSIGKVVKANNHPKFKVGDLKEGDIVLVSGAAGAVGSVVGQIAKIKGCTVIGIAGGQEKCDYLVNELGFDAAIDYKSEEIYAALKEKCPKGVDVYFDNVGGDILDAALSKLRMHARVVICGAISQYNNKVRIKGPSNYLNLLVKRASMQGMVVMDYAKDYGKAAQEMGMWIAQGKLKSKEAIFEGIENFYDTFGRLFSGDKKGKLILKVIED